MTSPYVHLKHSLGGGAHIAAVLLGIEVSLSSNFLVDCHPVLEPVLQGCLAQKTQRAPKTLQ